MLAVRSAIAACLAVGFLVVPQSSAAEENGGGFVTLGTQGGPLPSALRSQPANALVLEDGVYLVDTGDGAAGRLAAAGIPLQRLKGVFISHLHFDHTGGLAAILGLRFQLNAPGVLTVYGPPGTAELVAGLVASMKPGAEAGYGVPDEQKPDPAAMVSVVEIRDGARIELGGLTVTAAENTHYSFPEGSSLDQRFDSLSFRFDTAERAIVYTGDSGPSENLEKLAKGADLLVSEMIDLDATIDAVKRANPNMPEKALADMAHHLSDHHLTPHQVGQLASRAGVKHLVVTHLATGATGSFDTAQYIAAIASKFDGKVTIAEDLDRF
ncbi:MBL fold metallo-hydrolase [Hyphococcus sp.]|jgi:ribonuclease BN (tRNA processing enzyme)|uniref:MBL fold metallo-hydrolase n=1 Tax=Hyphococcus sp. TaxID=2038636 RepID=UPI003D0E3110